MSRRAGSERPDGGGGVDAPAWLTLDGDETLRWTGGPRIQTMLPAALVGVVLALVGVGLLVGVGSLAGRGPFGPTGTSGGLVGVGAMLLGAAIGVGAYLQVRNTDYAVTDGGLYRKQGVLSRTVTAVDYRTVQNVSYSQGVTGRLFGYGTLAFDTAGGEGTELAFSNLDDPEAVQRLVNDQLARARRGDRGESTGHVPGSVEQWEAVLGEVRAIRRTLEGCGEETVRDD